MKVRNDPIRTFIGGHETVFNVEVIWPTVKSTLRIELMLGVINEQALP